MKPIARPFAAHVGYGVLLFVLGLAAEGALDALSVGGVLPDALLVAAAVVPIAILLSRRIGRLSPVGISISAVIVALASQTAAIEILDRVARPAGGEVTWSTFIARGFGMGFAVATAIVVAAGVAWIWVIDRRAFARAH